MSEAPQATNGELTYSQSTQALDEILARFKSGNLPLEDALQLFEEGVSHLKNCQTKLSQAQGRVEKVTNELELVNFEG